MSYRSLLTGTGVAAILFLSAAAHAQTIITNSNGIIRNSLCVGGDCQSGIPFDDSTIILKENNTRIKFADTSNILSFPRTDWELEANSQSNGGPNRFSIFDCGEGSNNGGCSGSNVFTVTAGAGSNAVFVDSGGRVGFGTGTPVLELHVRDGDTPSLRLEQDNSSGFTPQTWDIAGNETNFFIRDVTNGSTLPLRIQPGAPSNAIFFNANGDATFGSALTGSSGSGNREVRLRSNDGAGQYGELTFVRGSADVFGVGADNNNFYIFGYGVGAGQNVMRINRTTGAVTFDGNVTINGTLTCNPGPC